jgi:hypothetical protein
MSYESSSSCGQRKSRNATSSQESIGLPHDEYRTLRRAQDRERLETHFEHDGSRLKSYIAPQSAYRNAVLSQRERLRVSEILSATRAALGPSFDFDDHSYERLQVREDEYQRSREWVDDEPRDGPIPKKYRDEFDRWWHEDMEDNDPDQYLADNICEAPWRKHVPPQRHRLNVERVPVGPCTSATAYREDSAHGSEYERPPFTTSMSSFDNRVKPLQRRRFMNRFHRD